MEILCIDEIMCAFYIPWIYCTGYNFLWMCVIKWLIAIEALQEGKRKQRGQQKKGRRRKNSSSLWAIHQCLQIGCANWDGHDF